MRPIRLSHLSGGILGLLILLLFGFGLSLKLKLKDMAEASHGQMAAMARQEMIKATAEMDRRLRDAVRSLAGWDETRQQLTDPEYYPFWRDQRVKASGRAPKSLLAMALYDASGAILQPDGRMPA